MLEERVEAIKQNLVAKGNGIRKFDTVRGWGSTADAGQLVCTGRRSFGHPQADQIACIVTAKQHFYW